MRSYRGVIIFLAAATVTAVTACSGSSAGGGGASATPSTLVVLTPTVASGLDPDGTNSADPATIETLDNNYARLVNFGTKPDSGGAAAPDYTKLVPGLATSWSQTGPQTWVFHLRSGVRSCAGNPLTAQDVVYSYQRAMSVSDAVPVTWFVGNVAGILPATPVLPHATAADKALNGEVKALSASTVQFTLQHPSALFPGILTNAFSMVFDAKAMQAHTSAADPWAHKWSQDNAAGFGAYCASAFRPGVSITYTANPGYYQKPAFKKVVVQAVPSDANRLTALESGSAQIVSGLTPSEYKSAASSPRSKVISYYGQNSLVMQVNFNYAPFSLKTNALIRQAIAYALPYQDIIGKVYFGTARRAYSPVPAGNIGYAQTVSYSTDLARARQLLAQAGFPGGKGLSKYSQNLDLYYPVEDSAILQPAALVIKNALQQIGMNITLTPITQATLYPRLEIQHNVPMVLDDHQVPIYPDAGYATQLDFVPAASGGVNNNTNYDNATVNKLLVQSLTMPDNAARTQVTTQIQQLLMTDLPWVPIASTESSIGVAKGITNWVGQPIGLLYSGFTAGSK